MKNQSFSLMPATLLAALVFIEVVSLILLFRNTEPLITSITLHGVVSVLGALLLSRKTGTQQGKYFFFGALFQLIFLLPMIGLVAAFIFSHHSRFINIKEKHEEEIDKLLHSAELNTLDQPVGDEKNYRELLLHQDAETYLQLILSTSYMDEANAVRILKHALNTDIENVRLLAQARLDSKENDINQTIDQYIELSQTEEHTKNPQLHLEIAQQYWKLANLGLAKDAVLNHVLEQLQKYTAIAKSINPHESQSYHLSAKGFLLEKNYSKAKKQFLIAIKAGIPRNKVATSLQEIAFFEDTARNKPSTPASLF